MIGRIERILTAAFHSSERFRGWFNRNTAGIYATVTAIWLAGLFLFLIRP